MKTKFPKETITQWSKEILLGLEFLHSHNIVHRDLKTSNLLLNNRGMIKVAGISFHLMIKILVLTHVLRLL